MSPYLGDLTNEVHTVIQQDNEFNTLVCVCVICTCMYVLVSLSNLYSKFVVPCILVASKRPRKHTRTYKKNSHKSTTSSDSDKDEDNLLYNSCSSVDCIHPHNRDKLVDWVQCDDCDDWYHVKCTGLTLESVRPKSAKFHCGCV